MQQLVESEKIRRAIHHLASEQGIQWKFSPSRSPHFGGLWESGVKIMKVLLRKTVGIHRELTTVLTEAEATLNSRPLLPTDSTPEDGVPVLTPGHFLIGRPLRAPPLRVDATTPIPLLRRWNLVRRLSAELWNRWLKEYLQEHQRREKWKTIRPNLSVGDIVLLKESDLGRRDWTTGRVIKVYPGSASLTRVVDVFQNGKTYKRDITKLVLLVPNSDHLLPGEDVQASG